MTTVGRISFLSSGQLDPSSSQGLNDIVSINLHSLAAPAPHQSYYAWLLPDKSQDEVKPFLLGKLHITSGKAQMTYTNSDHSDLLAMFSRFLVTEQAGNETPATPSLDPATWRYEGAIPNIPMPGDEKHYSLLSHLRHLVAKDLTSESIGLSGGLDIWLYRNAGKILEWSDAAHDDWAGGQASIALMRRQIDRVLDYLDGSAYVWRDVPANTPFLVDPKAGRIGLLEFDQTQKPPGYLAHLDIHLLGLSNSLGVTPDEKQRATQIDAALTTVTSLIQKIRKNATQLVGQPAIT